jgi:hypothetical protein
MRLEKKVFTATVTADVRAEEKIPAHFRPKAQISYILAGVFDATDANRITVQMYIFDTGEIILQKNYNDGIASDEKFDSG